MLYEWADGELVDRIMWAQILKIVAGPVVALLLAWLVGQRIAARWNLWQKRREFAMTAAAEFYKLYGEFFAVWKLWNYSLHSDAGGSPEGVRWKLMERAAAAEARVEALLVKLASEHELSADDIETLGKFRQAYQQLRETIRDNRKLDWPWSECPQYLAYKRLAVRVARLIAATDLGRAPKPSKAARALEEITSSQWESNWTEV